MKQNKKISDFQQHNSYDEAKHRITRDPIFTRFESLLFGVKHHTFNLVQLTVGHLFMIYYNYLWLTGQAPLSTILFELLYGYLGGLGITVGCHRYWSHKTFKANLPVQIFLMICQTLAAQWPIYMWCLHHRIHHKFTDTDSDPHNSKRGFWFSHMIWLVLPKHRDLKDKLDTFEMNDLEKDPVVRFQSKYYYTLFSIFFFVVPISAFYLIWDMPLLFCIAANYRRFIVSLHITSSVNSFAHLWGSKPYDKGISSVESPIVSLFAVGEGWHNYHHTFPWDYKASEFPWKFNVSTMVIDLFALFGWAWNLKTVSPQLLLKRKVRTGKLNNATDTNIQRWNGRGSSLNTIPPEDSLWGWDDEQMPEEFRTATTTLKVKRVS